MSHPTRSIPFFRPSLSESEKEYVCRVLDSGWITTGKQAILFEEEFKERTGVRHAFACSSATAGLHIALAANGIEAGDTVITSPYTFVSCTEVIHYCGAKVAFADIGRDDWNICPDRIQQVLETEHNVKAIMPVHIAGIPAGMDRICRMAEKAGAITVEDAAHAFPAIQDGRYLGTISDIGVYSFYATKTITSAEGGMVVTNDDSFAAKIRAMRIHGIDRDAWDRYSAIDSPWEYDVVMDGFKYNMSDVHAAIGRAQLQRADELQAQRQAIARTYNKAFANHDFLVTPPHGDDSSCHLYILRIVPDKLAVSRDDIMRELQERGIGVSLHYRPLHMMSYYRKKYGLQPGDYPESLKKYKTSISIPLYPGLTESEIEFIIESVIDIGKSHYRRNA